MCVFLGPFSETPRSPHKYLRRRRRSPQLHPYLAHDYISNGINILAGVEPLPVKFGPKGTNPQYEGCAFHTRRAVQSVTADLVYSIVNFSSVFFNNFSRNFGIPAYKDFRNTKRPSEILIANFSRKFPANKRQKITGPVFVLQRTKV